ncbi:hypothetical protein QFZ57_004244 [Arthrobacter sp. B1I2]|nr:hypothetical protein [Arthrobacter sp. B1I2]MDQ0733385.1 hypothetical protein [Arthrobacter sp. B1I2]
MFERTSVGLDEHARTVVSCALDAQTGEIIPHRMTPDYGLARTGVVGEVVKCQVAVRVECLAVCEHDASAVGTEPPQSDGR